MKFSLEDPYVLDEDREEFVRLLNWLKTEETFEGVIRFIRAHNSALSIYGGPDLNFKAWLRILNEAGPRNEVYFHTSSFGLTLISFEEQKVFRVITTNPTYYYISSDDGRTLQSRITTQHPRNWPEENYRLEEITQGQEEVVLQYLWMYSNYKTSKGEPSTIPPFDSYIPAEDPDEDEKVSKIYSEIVAVIYEAIEAVLANIEFIDERSLLEAELAVSDITGAVKARSLSHIKQLVIQHNDPKFTSLSFIELLVKCGIVDLSQTRVEAVPIAELPDMSARKLYELIHEIETMPYTLNLLVLRAKLEKIAVEKSLYQAIVNFFNKFLNFRNK
jgi:hypothetical protein